MHGTVTVYHVFTDNRDEWTRDLGEAKALFTTWGEEFGCARLYCELRDEDGETIEEDCLEATGPYPA